jgi:putative glutamine amidotransferase
VTCLGGGLLDVYGATPIEVNSRHHQCITEDRLAPGLEVTAVAPDGMIEGHCGDRRVHTHTISIVIGIQSVAHKWCVGVQWHPERNEVYKRSVP